MTTQNIVARRIPIIKSVLQESLALESGVWL